MAAARQLKPAIRGLNTTTIIGLMACTGLRLSECLKLDLQDVDFHESILTVNGKRGHQRLVPLHPSTARALVEYMRLSRQMVTGIHTDAFFINSYRNRPSPGTVEHAFRQLRTILAYGPPPGGRPPRLHDFRHTYTTTSLLQAYKDGKDIDAHIAALATYLGHVSPESTYWYLSAVPELMNLVAGRISPIDLTEAHHD